MRITDVRTAEVLGHGYSTFVRIYTDEGLFGTGECIHGGAGCPRLVATMTELLRGEDPRDVEPLFERIRRRYLFEGALAGNVVTALAGIEIALWDLAGKALGAPVYRLLGGRYRDRIRLYCDCHGGKEDTPASHAEQALAAAALGFTALKFDVDDLTHPAKADRWNHTLNAREMASMVEKVAAVREAVGPSIDLAIDMHGRYDTHSAIRLARALEPFELMWLEEPVPPENVDAMREVKRCSPVPICAGENLFLRWGFRDLLEKQAVDIIMPDLPKCGGLAEGKKIAGMAELYYIPIAPHNVCGPLGTLASCHAGAAIPNFLVLEWHWLERPYWNDLLIVDAPLIQNGAIRVPDRPGLGYELNEDVAQHYLRPGTTLFGEA
ncbi:MAG: mandelate racemase/muconate lactonizing enzyme family protein [Armatimonadetes bacterium]|nr:mandelate racemase/muconate lactonizing enzyme family protein [Armatimonadota bacterium]